MRRVFGNRVRMATVVGIAACGLLLSSGTMSAHAADEWPAARAIPVPIAQADSAADDSVPWAAVGLVGLFGLFGLVRPRRRRKVPADPFSAYPVMNPQKPRVRPESAEIARSGPAGSAEPPRPPAAAGMAPPAIPLQDRGAYEPRPLMPPPPADTATSVAPDGSIRLAPAPPLHAARLGAPRTDLPGGPEGSNAEPLWPQREYY